VPAAEHPAVSKSEHVDAEFRARIRRFSCPACGLEYTDGAIDWMEAWLEGQRDLMDQLRGASDFDGPEFERDGYIKIRCELCSEKAWVNCFGPPAILVRPKDSPSET
jgi:hypothetical protein